MTTPITIATTIKKRRKTEIEYPKVKEREGVPFPEYEADESYYMPFLRSFQPKIDASGMDMLDSGGITFTLIDVVLDEKKYYQVEILLHDYNYEQYFARALFYSTKEDAQNDIIAVEKDYTLFEAAARCAGFNAFAIRHLARENGLAD